MLPILYSYRRCPYAMRARMALHYAGIEVEHREISLREKPQSMLLISPKGTVPVLCIDGLVLEESLEIMRWALQQNDPERWLIDDPSAQMWLERNDGPFKKLLDQYKYPNRYPTLNQEAVLSQAIELMLKPMEEILQSHQYLLANRITWIDIAIFPFIRQFSMVDPESFQKLPIDCTRRWLEKHLASELFQAVMQKYPTWTD